MPETISPVEHEKPLHVYHASPKRNLERVVPQAKTVRREDEGPKVFGSETMAEATVHMVPANESWSQFGQVNGRPFALYTDMNRFLASDKGGSLYVLPSDQFDVVDEERPHEWTASESIEPIEKIEYDSALTAMVDNGVEVYFIDPTELEHFRQVDAEEKAKILDELKERGKQVRRAA